MTAEMIVFAALYTMFAAGYFIARGSAWHRWLAPGSFVLLILLFFWVVGRATLFPETTHRLVGPHVGLQIAHDIAGVLAIMLGMAQCATGALKLRTPRPVWLNPAHRLFGHATFVFMTASFAMSVFDFVVIPAIQHTPPQIVGIAAQPAR